MIIQVHHRTMLSQTYPIILLLYERIENDAPNNARAIHLALTWKLAQRDKVQPSMWVLWMRELLQVYADIFNPKDLKEQRDCHQNSDSGSSPTLHSHNCKQFLSSIFRQHK